MGSFWSRFTDAIKPLRLCSDEELSEIREKYRLLHCKGDSAGTRMIEIIDKEMLRRELKRNGPVDPSTLPRREHGWYLPNDD